MKRIIPIVIIGILTGISGYFIGEYYGFKKGDYKGYKEGYQSANDAFKNKSIDELKEELKEKEQNDILSYVKGRAEIKTINEGSLFKSKYVQYFVGTLTNHAILASTKDIKLDVEFISKTGSKIGNQEIIIYEYLGPGKIIEFKEKIKVPKQVENFEFRIVESKSE